VHKRSLIPIHFKLTKENPASKGLYIVTCGPVEKSLCVERVTQRDCRTYLQCKCSINPTTDLNPSIVTLSRDNIMITAC
jgi:hypothetical protein